MKMLYVALLLVINLMIGTSFADTKTHCKKNETDLFTCSIANSNKVVSLCGNHNEETKMITWMQYRFGKVGTPEMIYPATKLGSLNKFFGSRLYSPESSYFQYDIWFHIGAYNYSISASESGSETDKKFETYIYFNKMASSTKGVSMLFLHFCNHHQR